MFKFVRNILVVSTVMGFTLAVVGCGSGNDTPPAGSNASLPQDAKAPAKNDKPASKNPDKDVAGGKAMVGDN